MKLHKFSEIQFQSTIKTKLIMPFEQISSLDYLQNTTSPPPLDHFSSSLHPEPVKESDYQNFVHQWNLMKCKNLLQLFLLYSATDSFLLLDCITYHFEQLYNICGIYPSHFTTISSYSLRSALKNTADPVHKYRKIRIPLLSKDVYDVFSECLRYIHRKKISCAATAKRNYHDLEFFFYFPSGEDLPQILEIFATLLTVTIPLISPFQITWTGSES